MKDSETHGCASFASIQAIAIADLICLQPTLQLNCIAARTVAQPKGWFANVSAHLGDC